MDPFLIKLNLSIVAAPRSLAATAIVPAKIHEMGTCAIPETNYLSATRAILDPGCHLVDMVLGLWGEVGMVTQVLGHV